MTQNNTHADASPVLPADPEARSVRLAGAAFWVTLVLTCLGLLLTINQVFNLGLGGFRPISTAYYYLTIGVFVAIGFLAFPAIKGQTRVRWYDWLLSLAVLGLSIWIASRAQYILDRGWNFDAPLYATIIAGIYVLLALEGVRRTGETVLFVICLIFGRSFFYCR